MKATLGLWAVLIGCVANAVAQEEVVKRVDRFGEHSKILTPGQIDAWVFHGRKGETVIAWVASEQFDPVLELLDDSDARLAEVDDPGSQSWFTAVLPRDGSYRVRVRAFKDSGGGTYRLRLERFMAADLPLDTSGTGTIGFDEQGHHAVRLQAGDLVKIRLSSATVSHWEILDPKGQSLGADQGLVLARKEGTYLIRVKGPRGDSYGISLRKARIRTLDGDTPETSELDPDVPEAWDFPGDPADFVLLDIRRSGALTAEVQLVPDEKREGEGVLPPAGGMDEIKTLVRYEKGRSTLLACILGRHGKYRIVLQGTSAISVPYEIRLSRSVAKVAVGGEVAADLPVGGFCVYELLTRAGQMVTIDLSTDRFDSTLAVCNMRGDMLMSNDDRGLELSSRVTFMSPSELRTLLLGSSKGAGGGGSYKLAVREQPVNELEWGAKNEGVLGAGGSDIWQLKASKGRMLVISAVSKQFDTVIQVYDSKGVELANDDNGGTETNSLLALRPAEDGTLTVWISSKSGQGPYTIRLLEGE